MRQRIEVPNGFTIDGVKFWTCKPIVKVIAAPMILDDPLQEFIRDMDLKPFRDDQFLGTDAECLIETAGRDCYLSNGIGRPTGEYLENLKGAGHGSVFEHAALTFKIGAVSRGLTHELVRHRVGVAISQVSSRYVDPNRLGYVVPHKSRKDPRVVDDFVGICLSAQGAYDRLVQDRVDEAREAGIKKSDCIKEIRGEAREMLPIGLAQIMTFTANARILRHIVTMRGNGAAETQAQKFAHAILEEAKPHMPRVFDDWSQSQEEFEHGAF